MLSLLFWAELIWIAV
nr:hypothetical protein [Salmonella enterica]